MTINTAKTILACLALLTTACAQQQRDSSNGITQDSTHTSISLRQDNSPRHNTTVNITPEELKIFGGGIQYKNFNRMYELFPSAVLRPSPNPYIFPIDPPVQLPASYFFRGDQKFTRRFLDETDTVALIVLQDGRIKHEYYALTGGVDVQWISWSMAKSFTSALVGIALQEGLIGSINDDISDYLPALKVSAYEGATIKDVLQMSSGVRWVEDYSDPQSDVFRLGDAMYGQITFGEFIAGMKREFAPGTLSRYSSADTQALGLLLVAVTGRSVTEYMQEKLSDPLGMEYHGYWLTGKDGLEMVFGGLNLAAIDYAKIGELYRLNGLWQGKRILSRDWVQASVTPQDPHVQPGRLLLPGEQSDLQGYGYQWWTYAGNRGEFSANGVYNQSIFVDPPTGTTIVKLSATPTFGQTNKEVDSRRLETIAFLRAIVNSLNR